MLLHNMKNFRY